MQSAISWNQALNKARQEQRNCALDLQTWTIQFPQSKRSKMTKPMPKPGHYPLALIPGQYADYYRGYTPQELRYFPINTVLYGPMRPNEMHIMGGGSDGSQSESEDSSSSDDSSDTSSDDETEEDEREICKICGNDKSKNCSHCNIGISNSKLVELFQ
uniref:Uncharacterized protein n=2 Tax=Clastoptera arizonana TaxID=38151 RepID=A0A1B6D7N4_9HEMI